MADKQATPNGGGMPFMLGAARDLRRGTLTAVAAGYTLIQAFFVIAGSAASGQDRVDLLSGANYGYAIGIGLLVGATELIARYRDKPFEPLLSSAGLFYMLINGGASALAYYVILELNMMAGQHEVVRVLTAGVAAMALFRSGVFRVKVSGEDVTVGPNLILQILLNALDRTYDRERAEPRSKAVKQIMAGISFDVAQHSLPRLCYNLMQNVSDDEMTALDSEIQTIGEGPENDEAKALALGLILLNLVGEEVLTAAVDALGGTLQGVSKVSQAVQDKFCTVDPGDAIQMLPRVCNQIAHETRRLKTLEEVDALVAEIRAHDALSHDARAFETLLCMLAKYGEQTVEAGLNILNLGKVASATATPPPPPPPPPAEAAGGSAATQQG